MGGDAVEVILFHREMPLKTIRGTLDDQGMLLLGHTDRRQREPPGAGPSRGDDQDAASEMSTENTNAKVDIKVYEVTDEKPQWNVVLSAHGGRDSPGRLRRLRDDGGG